MKKTDIFSSLEETFGDKLNKDLNIIFVLPYSRQKYFFSSKDFFMDCANRLIFEKGITKENNPTFYFKGEKIDHIRCFKTLSELGIKNNSEINVELSNWKDPRYYYVRFDFQGRVVKKICCRDECFCNVAYEVMCQYGIKPEDLPFFIHKNIRYTLDNRESLEEIGYDDNDKVYIVM